MISIKSTCAVQMEFGRGFYSLLLIITIVYIEQMVNTMPSRPYLWVDSNILHNTVGQVTIIIILIHTIFV